jgi:lipopolysaccharide transport system ATP-binding protein
MPGSRKHARDLLMSSDDFAIRVQGLSKHYQIYDAPKDRLKQMLAPRLQRMIGKQPKQYFREFKALKNVSFEVKKGEMVGIIGRNGSGKSTLLQMICGTLSPTSGSVQTNGRIAALLELGSGFNSEFTGRENVYMNAAVLGLSREETDTKFDDIVTFADIGDFIAQPVKTYSSGMMVRLAFAVAINVDPEIMIIDEALSVGDELFQRKCFSRIEAIRARGATILFVSHSGVQIVELCDRAILIDTGEKLATGLPNEIVGSYQKLLYAPEDKHEFIREKIRQPGNRSIMPTTLNRTSQEDYLAKECSLKMHETFDPNLRPTNTIEYESLGPIIGNPVWESS